VGGSIRLLPSRVIDQIAAGEVVERPASVLKELLENALDAGASRVVVRASGGGIRLVEVCDDGSGMDRVDALEAFKRHTTSKIRSLEDLANLQSLGFRGEALSSIASVSRVELVTRPRGVEEATRVLVEGGVVREVTAWGAPEGTMVRVEGLFYNVPARRKFLRTEATEAHHLKGVLERIAILHPEVGFSYDYEERRSLEWPPVEQWAHRLRQVLGEEHFSQLFPVESGGQWCRIRGYLSHPNHHRSTASELWLYVNQRPVQDRVILGAILRGYGQLLDRGRYPSGVICLDLPPQDVDVNVHPAKREVRFRDPRRIQEEVVLAVRRFLREQPWVQPLEVRLEKPLPESSPGGEQPSCESLGLGFREGLESSWRPQVHEAPSGGGGQAAARYLGQAGGTYLIFETQGGILLVDQHAAHERILFEELRAQSAGEGVAGQRLLWSELIELDPPQEETLEEIRPELARLGWLVEPFGAGSWRILSVPTWMDPACGRELLMDLLDACRGQAQQQLESLLASMACREAVRAGKKMGPVEAMALLDRMRRSPAWGLCPHGRPVFIEIPFSEVRRRFGRS
jgi:DNA mismatch repair protein MutL